MTRVMPYGTALNRARMLKALGWDVYLLHEQPFANSQLLIHSARVFSDIWSQHFLLTDSNSAHDFIRKKGFDLLYTIGPPNSFNVNFLNAPCPWIHDSRDLFLLTDPQADDPEKLKEVQATFKVEADLDVVCVNGCDLAVFVTPWQKLQFNKRVYQGTKEKESVWLPNVPYFVPEISRDFDRDPETVYWGYVGNMSAAWQNAPDWVGQVVGEFDKLGTRHEFHHWSMMEMHNARKVDWYFMHETREQHEMIAEIGSLLDYGIVAPPTKSDGSNGQTGWPGKIGDYVAAGLTTFIPSDFMLASTIRRNGWGFAYDSPKDVARIMASRRTPQAPRQPAPYLRQDSLMSVLQIAVERARVNFHQRYAKPVQVQIEHKMEGLLVASDGNRFHAETHIAPVLDAPYTPIASRQTNELWPEHTKFKDLYMLGFWAGDAESVTAYAEFMGHFERIVLQWAGSDILYVKSHPDKENVFPLLKDERIVHFAPHRHLANEVRNVLDVECHIASTPTRFVYDQPFHLSRPFAVSAYYPNLPTARNTYRLDLVDEVIRLMPDTIFYLHAPNMTEAHQPELPENAVWLGAVGGDVYPEFLKTVSVFLRLTRHEGLPMSMVEHFCAGRRCVMTQDFPFTILVEPEAREIVRALEALKKEREPDAAAAEYWRTWNDYGRYRKRVRELFDLCKVGEHARSRTSQVA